MTHSPKSAKEVKPLFFVAIVPPEPVLAQVWALKQQVHQRTGSRNAVRLPPHITLLPPTRQPAEFEAPCRAVLQDFAATRSPFGISLENFGWFGSRTLFVRVLECPALPQLHADLLAFCAQQLPEVSSENRPFTPHMTLATRDLPADQVPALQQEFAARTFAATFEARALTLFRHDGQHWHAVADFPLGI
ncbi:2'-5' RNA ligase [Hymenobacter daecheongensis DSM 21074]|uniref:2'-5' RNA ligase n=1 Tax=Hymenobacter daecheongensis DSM 21074 TaxID=1121955 RepID=A0A1M6JPF5_9BACT|nr:2'-5' RNA ligase family protein [Hymenobacter daecheongensis]SHJ48605.1 2'-5' RNA ligase [Hymenobacter daecheongensis DSM 21074]